MVEDLENWEVPLEAQPSPHDYEFDLDRVLSSVVALTARVPEDAFTAVTLGTERAGNGVLVDDDGTILTIGYLVMEAEEIWLTTNDGRVVPGHVIESMWFQIDIAQPRNDGATIDLATRMIRRHLELGWDEQYGGLLLVKQAGNKAPQMAVFDANKDGKLAFGEYVKLVQALAPQDAGGAAK